jgi:ribosome-associated toxin RatA of RatAB toxin-antitoxin module
MAEAHYQEQHAVDSKQLFSVITQYEQYPDFVEGCQKATVTERSPGRVRVSYEVQVMSKDVHYVLDHQEDPETGQVQWSLVESNFFKKNNGSWKVTSLGKGKSEVIYTVDVEFRVPVPGFILSRLVKGSLPGMVKSFTKRATS